MTRDVRSKIDGSAGGSPHAAMKALSRRQLMLGPAGAALVLVSMSEAVALPEDSPRDIDAVPEGYALVCAEGGAGLVAVTAIENGVVHRVIARMPH